MPVDSFFQDFARVFDDLQMDLLRQTGDVRWAHHFALQFLTRLMFLCFLEQKSWLDDNPRYLEELWRNYGKDGRRPDSFVGEWLEVLLFEAFSYRFQPDCKDRQYLPASIRSMLTAAPYLHSDLFARNELDRAHRPTITDARFQQILQFLESHDFAIEEDGLLDQAVAVNPAMMGQVYESLVDLFEPAGERGKAGIFYTPRVEIDLMCRLSLVDWLANHLGPEHKASLYDVAFAFDLHDREVADAALADRNLWPRLEELLRNVAVVDPACGSGSFVTGMLYVLDDLQARAQAQVGGTETPFGRKRRIIESNLFGVDVKKWAVEIARLRLWLQLIVDAPFAPAGCESQPLLPDLSSNLRCGDSLVQRADGAADAPFFWRVAFSEVFAGERAGFDIVIGNPPYVRQELIQDPRQPPDSVTVADRRAYKKELARAVYNTWPRTFGYDRGQGEASRRLAARSDLYIYFYFHGLSLLGDKGSLCFIASSSWLDVQYGRDLQEFLLTRGQVKLVMDNASRRSFASADVNTAIVLLGTAYDAQAARQASLQQVARFVTLRMPYDRVLSPAIWKEIETVPLRRSIPGGRVFPLTQAEILNEGADPQRGRYMGDKWGAKYLRAPDIYWTVLERNRDKLVRLGDIARVRRGITTGANDFFFLDQKELAIWRIEGRFLAPAVKSPRGLDKVWLQSGAGPPHHLFVCHAGRTELAGTGALDYIRYGEAQGLHQRPTCRNRSRWWDLGHRAGSRVHCSYLVDQVMRSYASDRPLMAGDNFQEIHSEIEPEALAAACNSTICQLAVNVFGRSNFGGGLLKVQTYEVQDLWIPDPRLLNGEVQQVIRDADLLDLHSTGRRALDDIIFDLLELTPYERDAVYEAVTTLVTARVSRAQSLGMPKKGFRPGGSLR